MTPTEATGPLCLRLTTGSDGNKDGTLNVQISTGYDIINATTNDDSYVYNYTEVVPLTDGGCYSTAPDNPDFKVLVSNPTTDSWVGSIEYTVDNGVSWKYMYCKEGCTGRSGSPKLGSTEETMGVSGNDVSGGDIRCLDSNPEGKQCELVTMEVYDTLTREVSIMCYRRGLYDVSLVQARHFSYPILFSFLHRHIDTTQPSGEPTLTPTSAEPSSSPTTANPTSSPSSQPTTSAPTTITCLQVITGSGITDGGYIDVYVDTGDGVYRNVSQIDLKYDSGEVVSLADDGCYENLVNVQIDSMKNDAWSGSIKSSGDPADNNPFVPMTCISASCAGDINATDNIVIDGGANPDVGDIINATLDCLPGIMVENERMGPCTLQVAEVEEDTPVVSFCVLRSRACHFTHVYHLIISFSF